MKVVYAYVIYILYSLASTVVNIPYHALTPVLSEDPQQRTEIVAWKQGMGTVSQFVITILALPLVELFGGGKGTLELVEDEDILECGIRIIAQPPGKKLQNMMQMSGGEKSLTAIALLFAIQNLKPSPFCLLDEIEAALDDSNVTRFAKYLHKLTQNTQFIVITHRRGTMAAADRLYGITMQEKGVSTLVSVNLIENDLDK
jgi:Na+/melibiose symporter-like transporter